MNLAFFGYSASSFHLRNSFFIHITVWGSWKFISSSTPPPPLLCEIGNSMKEACVLSPFSVPWLLIHLAWLCLQPKTCFRQEWKYYLPKDKCFNAVNLPMLALCDPQSAHTGWGIWWQIGGYLFSRLSLLLPKPPSVLPEVASVYPAIWKSLLYSLLMLMTTDELWKVLCISNYLTELGTQLTQREKKNVGKELKIY